MIYTKMTESFWPKVAAWAIIILGASVVYGVGLVIYRLTLHPLAKFPGRKIAAASKWYEFYYDIIKGYGGQYYLEIDKMHEEYGPIVRINPDEIHIRDTAYHPTVYAAAPARRDKYLPAAKMSGDSLGTHATVEHDVYRKRRAANSIFFSKRAVAGAEWLVREEVELLCSNMYEQSKRGEPISLHTSYLAFTTDVIGRFLFGKTFRYQHDYEKASNWQKTMTAVAQVTPLIKQFPGLHPIIARVPPSLVEFAIPHLNRLLVFQRDMYKMAAEYLNGQADSEKYVQAASLQRSSIPPTIFHAIDQSSALPASDKTVERLRDESVVLISAGSETTARALMYATYHVLAHGEVLARLRAELAPLMPTATTMPEFAQLERLPLLGAVLRENLRAMALTTSRLPLVAPTPLQYGGWTIPAGTPVGMTIADMMFDPAVFGPDPRAFRPDRWLDAGGQLHGELNQAFVPFGRGQRMCQGMDFAWVEMYVTLAALVRRFDMELFETEYERDVKVVRDCFIGATHPSSKGMKIKITGMRE